MGRGVLRLSLRYAPPSGHGQGLPLLRLPAGPLPPGTSFPAVVRTIWHQILRGAYLQLMLLLLGSYLSFHTSAVISLISVPAYRRSQSPTDWDESFPFGAGGGHHGRKISSALSLIAGASSSAVDPVEFPGIWGYILCILKRTDSAQLISHLIAATVLKVL